MEILSFFVSSAAVLFAFAMLVRRGMKRSLVGLAAFSVVALFLSTTSVELSHGSSLGYATYFGVSAAFVTSFVLGIVGWSVRSLVYSDF